MRGAVPPILTGLCAIVIISVKKGTPVDLKNATKRRFKDLLKAAELPPIRVYDLRRTHASNMPSAGA